VCFSGSFHEQSDQGFSLDKLKANQLPLLKLTNSSTPENSPMEALAREIRFGIRSLLKQRAFTALSILTLALGIGTNTAMFSVINAVLLRPLPYPQPDRLVWMNEAGDEVSNRMVSYPNFVDWRERNHLFESLTTYRTWNMTLTGAGEPQSISAGMVTADYFKVMGVAPILGRAFLAEDDRPGSNPVVVISFGFWQKHFAGDAAVISKTLTLDDRPFTVIGVTPESFAHQGPPPFWVTIGPMNWTDRDVRIAGNVIARLKPGVSIQQARSDINAVSQQLAREHPVENGGANRVDVVSLQEHVTGNVAPALWILFGAVGMVLLIACVNVANLILARAASRRSEFAVRAALGASRIQVVRQLLIESLLLALAGGVCGLVFAVISMKVLTNAAQEMIPRLDGLSLSYPVLGFNLVVSMVSGIIFGLVPALRYGTVDVYETLKDSSARTGERQGARLRGALVVAQVAIAVALLVGAGLLIRSLSRLSNQNPGFEFQSVLKMEINVARSRYQGKGELARLQQQILDQIAARRGVEAATLSTELPGFAGGWTNDILPEGHPPLKPGELINVDWAIVSRDYFRTLQIPILRGRSFTTDEDANGKPVVLVDENLARRFWPNQEAVGKHIKYDGPDWHEVIGVVKEVGIYGSESRPLIKIYTPLGRATPRRSVLSVRTSLDPNSMVAPITAGLHDVDKDLPVSNVATFATRLAHEISPKRFNTTLLSMFAAFALLLAATGIYGLIAYSVVQRTREIGVRVALGATPHKVMRLFVGQGMKLVLPGLAIGLSAAFALTRVMISLLFGVKPTDAATFIIVSICVVLVSVVACYVPARRASKVDPLVALRHE
jgi:putative ABC transport system permease protein